MSRPAESPGRIGEHRSGVAPSRLVLPAPPHDLGDARPAHRSGSPAWSPNVARHHHLGTRTARVSVGVGQFGRGGVRGHAPSRRSTTRYRDEDVAPCPTRGHRHSSGWRPPPSRARRPPTPVRSARRDALRRARTGEPPPHRPAPSMPSIDDLGEATGRARRPGRRIRRRPPGCSIPLPSTSTGTSCPSTARATASQLRLVGGLHEQSRPVRPPDRW